MTAATGGTKGAGRDVLALYKAGPQGIIADL